MAWIQICACSAIIFCSSLDADLKSELSEGKDWQYQDLRINGEIFWKGCGPDCALRFEALRPFFNRFLRPFSVLELGANNGYFSLKIAEDYDAICFMIDGTDRLRKICEYNNQVKHIVYFQKFLTANDIELLAEHEHFDVVLCFHLLHHVDWKRFVPALFKLGDHVIIETPPVNDGFVSDKPTIPEIANYLLSLPKGIQIGSFVRQSPEIRDHMLLFSQVSESSDIHRDFEHSEQLIENRWEPIPIGISYETFYFFNGVFPDISKASDKMKFLRLTKE